MRRSLVLLLLVGCGLSIVRAHQGDPSEQVGAALDLYSVGRFDEAADRVRTAGGPSLGTFAQTVKQGATRWLERQQSNERRNLIVASFLQEVARGVYASLQRRPGYSNADIAPRADVELAWRSLRPLMEWSCDIVRNGPSFAGERQMWRASLDVYRLFRDTDVVPLEGQQQSAALQPSGHLAHVASRLPNDAIVRLALAERSLRQVGGLAGSRSDMSRKDAAAMAGRNLGADPSPDAMRQKAQAQALMRQAAVEPLLKAAASDPLVGGEVALQRGAIAMSFGEVERARAFLARAQNASEDRDIRYLALFLSGWLEDGQTALTSAEAFYTKALETIPGAQSATTTLAQQLWLSGRMLEAQQLIVNAIDRTGFPIDDPWPAYRVVGYISKWPTLRAQLREALR